MRALSAYIWGEWRRRAPGLVVVGVIVALAAGSVLALVAGARRTESALARSRVASVAADAMVQYPELDDDPERRREVAGLIAALPGVRHVGEVQIYFVYADDGVFDSGDISYGNLATASVDGVFGTDIERGRLLAGSRPAPDDPHAVSVSETLARRLDLAVGDQVAVDSLSAEQRECIFTGCPLDEPEGPSLELRVAAIERFVAEAYGPTNAQQFLLTPAFVTRYHDEIANFSSMYAVTLEDGLAGVDRLREQVLDLVDEQGDDPEEAYVSGALDQAAGIVDASDAAASGLRIVAVIAGVVGAAVLIQALFRQLVANPTDDLVLRGIGVTVRQRIGAGLAIVAPALVGGVVLAAGGATAASTRFPIGQARLIEPDPGVDVDGEVLVIGALVALAIVVALAAAVTETVTRRTATARGATPVPALLTAARSPALRLGVRSAIQRSAHATGASRLQSIGGAIVAIVVLTGALVFGRSLERFVDSPARDGWGFDMEIGIGDEVPLEEALASTQQIAERDGVAGAALYVMNDNFDIGGRTEALIGTRTVAGDVTLTTIAGRAPAGPAEVALGAGTADRMGVEVGDRVDLTSEEGRAVSVEVVGLVRMPVIASDAPDIGAWATIEGFQRLAAVDGAYPGVLASIADGVDARAVSNDLARDYSFVDPEPRRSSDANTLRGLRVLTDVVVGLAAALGLLAVGHALMVGVRARRGELLILRAIGCGRRTLWSTISWQATAVAAIGLVVGLPVGVAIGARLWSTMAASIGAADDSIVPSAVVLTVPVALLLSNVIALLPGRRALARSARIDGRQE